MLICRMSDNLSESDIPDRLHPEARELYIRVVFDLEPYMVELGHKFQEHDMRRHLEHLRRYYREHRRRAHVQAARARGAAWEVDLVLTWLFLFRIPPFEHLPDVNYIYPFGDNYTSPSSRCCLSAPSRLRPLS